MKKLCVILSALFLMGISLQAQCPPSTEPGVHVVQQDENLFRIALMYGISLNRLLQLNNMQETDLLPACKKLRVGGNTVQPIAERATASASKINYNGSQTNTNYNTAGYNSGSTIGQKQAGNKHVVQAGETVSSIARLYGYTEERFREFNAMGNERLIAGSTVLSHDCACNPILSSGRSTPQGEVVTYQPPTTTISTGTDSGSGIGETTTTFYEGAKPTRITKHEPVTPTQVSGGGRLGGNTGGGATNDGKGSLPASDAPYMKSIEMDMHNEINLLRANPPAYIKHVDEYIATKKVNWPNYRVDMDAVNELKGELRKLGALSQLQPMECVYTAARKHGEDLMNMGRTDHIGSDGKWPWDRVRRECPDLADGNENLVGGPENVRHAVILLLIDEGIPNRGHRKTLLRSDWVYGASYKIGTVGMMPNCWVQKFGF